MSNTKSRADVGIFTINAAEFVQQQDSISFTIASGLAVISCVMVAELAVTRRFTPSTWSTHFPPPLHRCIPMIPLIPHPMSSKVHHLAILTHLLGSKLKEPARTVHSLPPKPGWCCCMRLDAASTPSTSWDASCWGARPRDTSLDARTGTSSRAWLPTCRGSRQRVAAT